jgi:hypothetical protein
MEQFMHAFDSNLAPIVGQQITLTGTNGATVGPRIDLLISRALAGESDLIVKGYVNGKIRGWLFQGDGSFKPDKSSEPAVADADLRATAFSILQELTYTSVPPGSGLRAGIDQDEDGVLDGDDNCPGRSNAGQANTDSDGAGDVCDNCTMVANANQRDTDGDGYGNMCDADLNNNGLVNAVDQGILRSRLGTTDPDADLNGNGIVNAIDLGILRSYLGKPPGPSGLAP